MCSWLEDSNQAGHDFESRILRQPDKGKRRSGRGRRFAFRARGLSCHLSDHSPRPQIAVPTWSATAPRIWSVMC